MDTQNSQYVNQDVNQDDIISICSSYDTDITKNSVSQFETLIMHYEKNVAELALLRNNYEKLQNDHILLQTEMNEKDILINQLRETIMMTTQDVQPVQPVQSVQPIQLPLHTPPVVAQVTPPQISSDNVRILPAPTLLEPTKASPNILEQIYNKPQLKYTWNGHITIIRILSMNDDRTFVTNNGTLIKVYPKISNSVGKNMSQINTPDDFFYYALYGLDVCEYMKNQKKRTAVWNLLSNITNCNTFTIDKKRYLTFTSPDMQNYAIFISKIIENINLSYEDIIRCYKFLFDIMGSDHFAMVKWLVHGNPSVNYFIGSLTHVNIAQPIVDYFLNSPL